MENGEKFLSGGSLSIGIDEDAMAIFKKEYECVFVDENGIEIGKLSVPAWADVQETMSKHHGE